MIDAVLRLLCSWVRLCRTERRRAPGWMKVVLTAMFLPPFSLLYALLKVRTRLSGPWEVQATTRFGQRFLCRPPDIIQMYLHLFGVWEPDLTAFMQRRLKAGDVCIDVGANVGYHSLVASLLVESAGGVVAIEASPRIFALLLDNLRRNGPPANVRAVNMAAADRRMRMSIYSGPVHNIGLTTTVPDRGLPMEARIDAAPLGELLEAQEIARARLIKIDVEGAEPAVLAGMAALIARLPREVEILLELSPHWWNAADQRADHVLRPYFEAGFIAYEIDNNLWPWRYLWPMDVQPPRRIGRSITGQPRRLDLVLSRIDADRL